MKEMMKAVRLVLMKHIIGLAVTTILVMSGSAWASVIPTGLGSFTNPVVVDFESPPEGNISGSDSYFTNLGISSITAVSGGGSDIYNSFLPNDKGLFHNSSTGLLIDKINGTSRTFNTATVFTINFAKMQTKFGLEILDQLNDTYTLSFYDGVNSVGSVAFTYPTANVTDYFQNSDQFDRVTISSSFGAGYGIDNVTFEAPAIPEPSTVALLGLGGLLLWRRRK